MTIEAMGAGASRGTTTFLLTDIEGSSRAWEADPARMREAVDAHDALIARVVEDGGGRLIKARGEGDSTFSVFDAASDAAVCALEIQKKLPDGLRVRIAVHTGEAFGTDDTFLGPTVNRAARIRSAGHGGQNLLSEASASLVRDALPDGASLRDLGEHRLADLARPERLFELVHPDLLGDFPPPRTLDVVPNNLPVQLWSFVGRETEIADVTKLLADNRLVTLTGTGGCGKTRLALQVAAGALADRPSGVWLVDLGPINDPELVSTAVTTAIGLRDATGDLVGVLVRHLATRSPLIVLANCEHLMDACRDLTDKLLRGCPSVTVLATSREPLGVDGETAWRVPSLSLPADDAHESEAVRLFVDRATRARRNFALTPDNAGAVAGICRRLDGIPLAIELAASRVRVLTPKQILDGLTDRFRLLTGGSRTSVQRQNTLRASVDWSHDLLDETECILFRRASVFAGGFTLEKAEQICADESLDAYSVLDVLERLVDRSLVQMNDEGDEARYGMLETIRQYGREKLIESGEALDVRTRHRDVFRAMCEQALDEVVGGWERWWGPMLNEMDNVRLAIEWSRELDDFESVARLANPMIQYTIFRVPAAEPLAWIALALDHADRLEPMTHGLSCWSYGMLGLSSGALPIGAVAERVREGGRIAEALGDPVLAARVQGIEGLAAMFTEETSTAGEMLRSALDLARSAGDAFSEAFTMFVLGMLNNLFRLDPVEAERWFGPAVELHRSLGWSAAAHMFEVNAAEATLLRGRLADARSRAEAARDGLRDWGLPLSVAGATAMLASTHAYGGDLKTASRLADEATQAAAEFGDGWIAIQAAAARALVAFASGRPEESLAIADLARMAAELGGLRIPPSSVTLSLAQAEAETGKYEDARARVDALLGRDLGAWGRLSTLNVQGRIARLSGTSAEAESPCITVLTDADIDPINASLALETLAGAAVARGDADRACRLAGAAQSVRDTAGTPRWPVYQATWDEDIATMKGSLAAEAFDAAWAEGSALTFDDAIAYATRGRGARGRPASGWDALTPAEIEVTKLVAEGCGNAEIGKRLFVSISTVKTHMEHVFAKLGVSSRAEVASAAARRASMPVNP